MAKMGRKPLPPEQRGKKTMVYLSADALEAVEELRPPGERSWLSALVSALLVAEVDRRRRAVRR